MKTTIAQEMIREAQEEGFRKGELRVMRLAIPRIGQGRLGPPNELFLAELNSVTDIDRLYRMVDRLADGGSWYEFLAVK